MPSPACLVNGIAPPQAVAASSSNTIALESAAGVQYWSIAAITTDELNSPSAVNATLVVDPLTHTATFTAPSGLGSAVRFQSIVGVSGLGLDVDGVSQPSYTTTFKVNVNTGAGLSVLAFDETTEQGDNGWIAEVNALIRLGTGAGGAPLPIGITVAQATVSSSARVAGGEYVLLVTVAVTTPYTGGSNPALSIGTSASPSLLVPSSDIDLTTVGYYSFAMAVPFATAAAIQATFSGSATAGAAYVLVQHATPQT